MPICDGVVEAHTLLADGSVSVRIRYQAREAARPGQALAAFRQDYDWHCHTLIPTERSLTGITAHLPDGSDWPPGTKLSLRGPFGAGFRPPSASSRWLLVSLGATHAYLEPLMHLGLELAREVALFTDNRIPGVPAAVEVLSQAEDGLPWADYVAIGVPITGLDELSGRLEKDSWRLRRKVHDEVLVVSPLPCGMGTCQACQAGIRGSHRLLCVDGPIFPLTGLIP